MSKEKGKTQWPDWKLDGEYIESCSCDVSCPCLISAQAHNTILPDYLPCDVILSFIIDKGHFEDVVLDGCKFVIAFSTPREMCLKNWTTAYYIDAKTPEQQAALTTIVTGQAGGPTAGMADHTAEGYGVKLVDISYERPDIYGREAEIPGIMKVKIKAKIGQHDNMPIVYENASDIAYVVTQSYGTDVRYNDNMKVMNNTGRNAFYGRYVWVPESPIGIKYDRYEK